jgi:hypothetical protein
VSQTSRNERVSGFIRSCYGSSCARKRAKVSEGCDESVDEKRSEMHDDCSRWWNPPLMKMPRGGNGIQNLSTVGCNPIDLNAASSRTNLDPDARTMILCMHTLQARALRSTAFGHGRFGFRLDLDSSSKLVIFEFQSSFLSPPGHKHGISMLHAAHVKHRLHAYHSPPSLAADIAVLRPSQRQQPRSPLQSGISSSCRGLIQRSRVP